MDKLLKEAQEQGKIQESLTFFWNAISSLSGYFEEFKNFIDIYILDFDQSSQPPFH